MSNYIGNQPAREIVQYYGSRFDYVNTGNPVIDTNPQSVGATWLNLTTGEEFVCTDNTADSNYWIGSFDSVVSPLESIPDLFAKWSFSTNANDEYGSNDGTVTGATQQNDYYVFSGSGQYIDFGTLPGVEGTDITVSMWVYPKAATFGLCMDKGLSALSFENGAALSPTFYIQNGGPTSFGTLTQNTWAHLVATYDGVTMKTYLNGSPVNSTARTSSILAANNFQLGGRTYAPATYFNGRMKLVRLYTRALDLTEVGYLYGEV